MSKASAFALLMPSSWARQKSIPVIKATVIAAIVQRRFMTFSATRDASMRSAPRRAGRAHHHAPRSNARVRCLVAGEMRNVQRSARQLAQAGVDLVQHGGARTQRLRR